MQIYVDIWALRDKALRDDPSESFAAFYWLLIKYRWSQTSWTDFSPNQILPKNIDDLFLLCGGGFRSRARQRDRSCFTDVHFWTSMQIWYAKRMFADLFFHSPNEFFTNTKNLFNCKCISFPEAWITVWGNLRFSIYLKRFWTPPAGMWVVWPMLYDANSHKNGQKSCERKP